MKQKKIAVCGANAIQIKQLLDQFAKQNNVQKIACENLIRYGLCHLYTKKDDTPLHFIYINGAFIDPTHAFQALLEHADMVLYVICGMIASDVALPIPYSADDQRKYLSMHREHAATWQVTDRSVPWIWVVTKNTPGSHHGYKSIFFHNPLKEDLPADQLILECDIDLPTDSMAVWKAIISAL